MAGWGSIYTTTRASLREHSMELARFQEMASSGRRVSRASDAPTDAFRIMGMRSEIRAVETYSKNLENVSDSLSIASTALDQTMDIMTRVKQLVTQAASGTYSDTNRELIAGEVDSLLEQVVSLANTRHKGQYLFAGSSTDTLPYAVERDGGRITRVVYNGSTSSLQVPVGPGVSYGGVLVGEEMFRSRSRGAPVFLGQTGAAAGAGTSSVQGEVRLQLARTATAFGGASGVASGASSALDTVLGPGHALAIDATARTLKLDGGAEVSYAAGATDVRVAGPGGAVVYVDTSGIVAGFSGTVTVTGSGTASIDGGLTTTAINFADANQAVVDSRTGRVLYVDQTATAVTGTEPVHVPGTFDLFGALIAVRDALENDMGLASDQQHALINESFAVIDGATQGLTESMTRVGARLGAIDTLRDTLAQLKDYSTQEADGLANADIVEVATELARRQTLYEMTLATSSRLLSLSLLDFIS